MSAETINTFASLGTFVVIAVTAIAALVQLGHLLASNQLQALLALTDRWNVPRLQRSVTYVLQELPKRVTSACSWWEQVGGMLKYGLIPKDPFLDLSSGIVATHWDALAPTVGIVRTIRGPATYVNFEYLALLSKQWVKQHPGGEYPSGAPRLPIPRPGEPGWEGLITR